VPKEKVTLICRMLAAMCVHAPVTLRQVIAADIAGTGCDVIATRDMACT
jgi:CxxC motif-containing protein